MTPKYLYPRSRARELQGALFIGGFGMYVETVEVFSYSHPLHWLNLTVDGQTMLAAAMVLSSAIWAAGIAINGRWIGSPFLRLFSMLFNLSVAILATWQGFGTTAFYTYSWVTLFLVGGVSNVARDCWAAMKGRDRGLVVV